MTTIDFDYLVTSLCVYAAKKAVFLIKSKSRCNFASIVFVLVCGQNGAQFGMIAKQVLHILVFVVALLFVGQKTKSAAATFLFGVGTV